MTALLSLVTDKNSADIRSSAALALSKLFEAILHASSLGFYAKESLPEALSATLGKLLENLRGEVNGTSRACVAECLRDVLQACYDSGMETSDGGRVDPACLPDIAIAGGMVEEIMFGCSESVERRKLKEKAFEENEGLEEEDLEAFAESWRRRRIC